jgi:hypothetical protein
MAAQGTMVGVHAPEDLSIFFFVLFCFPRRPFYLRAAEKQRERGMGQDSNIPFKDMLT